MCELGGGLAGYRLSYVDGNRSLVDWMEKSRFAGPAIYTSSVSVYPDSQGGWVGESNVYPHSERAKIMLEAEEIFLSGPPTVVKVALRLGGYLWSRSLVSSQSNSRSKRGGAGIWGLLSKPDPSGRYRFCR